MTLKINRVRPLVLSSMCTKFEGPSWNSSVCIVFTSFVDRPTDRQTDGRTDGQTDAQTPAPYHKTSRQVGRIKIRYQTHPAFIIIGRRLVLASKGSGGGRVVKLLTCGARGPGFDYRFRHLNFRDWLSPASMSRYGWNTAKSDVNPEYNQPTNWPVKWK